MSSIISNPKSSKQFFWLAQFLCNCDTMWLSAAIRVFKTMSLISTQICFVSYPFQVFSAIQLIRITVETPIRIFFGNLFDKFFMIKTILICQAQAKETSATTCGRRLRLHHHSFGTFSTFCSRNSSLNAQNDAFTTSKLSKKWNSYIYNFYLRLPFYTDHSLPESEYFCKN